MVGLLVELTFFQQLAHGALDATQAALDKRGLEVAQHHRIACPGNTSTHLPCTDYANLPNFRTAHPIAFEPSSLPCACHFGQVARGIGVEASGNRELGRKGVKGLGQQNRIEHGVEFAG